LSSRQFKSKHSTQIDCLRYYDNSHILSKSNDGRIILWDFMNSNVIREFKGVRQKQGLSSRFDLTRDNKYLCIGSAEGNVFIFDTTTGIRVNKLEHKRSKSPVNCCALSCDCSNVVFVTSDAIIWVYGVLK